MKDILRALKEETCKVWRDHILPMKKKVKNRPTSRPIDKRTDNPLKATHGRIKKNRALETCSQQLELNDLTDEWTNVWNDGQTTKYIQWMHLLTGNFKAHSRKAQYESARVNLKYFDRF